MAPETSLTTSRAAPRDRATVGGRRRHRHPESPPRVLSDELGRGARRQSTTVARLFFARARDSRTFGDDARASRGRRLRARAPTNREGRRARKIAGKDAGEAAEGEDEKYLAKKGRGTRSGGGRSWTRWRRRGCAARRRLEPPPFAKARPAPARRRRRRLRRRRRFGSNLRRVRPRRPSALSRDWRGARENATGEEPEMESPRRGEHHRRTVASVAVAARGTRGGLESERRRVGEKT